MRWLFALFLVLFTTTSIAVIAGRLQPLPEPLRSLHLTDCRPPCWIGITPGQTTFEEAKQRISEVYEQYDVNDQNYVWEIEIYIPNQTNLANTVTILADDNGKVDSIYFLLEPIAITHWELLSLWETPSMVVPKGTENWGNPWYPTYFFSYGDDREVIRLHGLMLEYPHKCQNAIKVMLFHQGNDIQKPLPEEGFRWTGYRSFLQAMGCKGDEFLR